ncbi:MAG TPA: LysR family transcriptional regulator [Burkholderiales bacterium]|jgi:DNA-binding transcriptional LysR family regulator|nr:LysR family transcriptional regulator [Burkholderiales bacterium]
MKFSLSDLEAFVAVAELASFRKAADSVHLSQPALSRRVGKLEGTLGVRLFDRTTRTVNLTAVGRDFAGKARGLLDELERSLLAMSEVAATQAGEVTVACVPSAAYYFLPDVIRRYHERFPRIRVRIVDEAANTVLAAVVRGEADFGLNFIGTQDPDLDFQPILKEPFVAACRRDHPLAGRRKVTWAELGAYDFMTVSKSSGNRLLIDLALADMRERPRWFYEVRHVSTLLGLVEAGLGVAAVPQLAMPAADHPTLASVPLVEPAVTRTLGLIRRQGRTLSPSAQELYAMLETQRPARAATRRKSAQ